MARRVNDKDMREEIDKLKREGWTVENGGKHLKVKTPDGRFQFSVSTSPSRVHAVNDMRKQILHTRRKMAGLVS